MKEAIHLENSSLKYPLPEPFIKELAEELSKINEYPSRAPYHILCTELSEYTGVTPNHILPANGSDEVIEALTRAFGEDLILIPVPTFAQYEVSAKRNNAQKKLVPCLHGYEYKLKYSEDDLKKASLVWICNPNNPTGTIIPREEIIKILNNASGIVAVDECNYEYTDESVVDLIEQFPNLVISRSFSKNFGLAGLRLGFAISSKENVNRIARYCQNFRVNRMAEMAGIKVLKYLNYFQKAWREIARVREFFINGLNDLDIYCFPSKTNYVLVDFVDKKKTEEIWQYLRNENIFTFASWGEEFSGLGNHFIRFTISNHEDMAYVLKLLERFLKNNSKKE